MSKLPFIISSMRLRTLPLSLAGVLTGIFLAAGDGPVSAIVIVFTLLTTVGLQILSNLSNELGDFRSGLDRDGRQGPCYSLQVGGLTVREFRITIAVTAALCCVCGLLMVGFSYGWQVGWQPAVLLLLGASAIWAAMRYTLGKNPYGYRGLGDLFVFLFFGLVSVMGGYFVIRHTLSAWLLLPASAVGLFSVGVLNVNNIRDMASDEGIRRTVPLRIGERKAKIYQTVLITSGCLLFFGYLLCQPATPWRWLSLVTLPLYAMHLAGVWKRSGKSLDPMLPLLVITTFLLSLLAGFPIALQ